MRKSILLLALILIVASIPVMAGVGNDLPSGAHFNLNLIGVSNDKSESANMDKPTGTHVIFVPLEGKTRILLSEGDYQVLDKDGTDGKAEFMLPNPDPENDGVTEYSVYARVLGKSGGSGIITTMATDPVTGEEVASVMTLELERTKGKPKTQNVSKELLYIYADIDADGVMERVPLFSDILKDYLWEYDNSGLKVVQLRFYEVVTDVNEVPAP